MSHPALFICSACMLFLLSVFCFPLVKVIIQPIQYVHVKVSKKKKGTSFYVTFEFPDGSEKEFVVGHAFNDLQENDTGMLSYKEAKTGSHPPERKFISFEKDPESGGIKVETRELPEKKLIISIICVFALILLLITASIFL